MSDTQAQKPQNRQGLKGVSSTLRSFVTLENYRGVEVSALVFLILRRPAFNYVAKDYPPASASQVLRFSLLDLLPSNFSTNLF